MYENIFDYVSKRIYMDNYDDVYPIISHYKDHLDNIIEENPFS